mmetsp:Transcript_18627/g.52013  ORF Transcript_18627/g.52013 Transcript_18627/m.52013 type:complete len:287 (+) Transcript_18627:221-1081(+)
MLLPGLELGLEICLDLRHQPGARRGGVLEAFARVVEASGDLLVAESRLDRTLARDGEQSLSNLVIKPPGLRGGHESIGLALPCELLVGTRELDALKDEETVLAQAAGDDILAVEGVAHLAPHLDTALDLLARGDGIRDGRHRPALGGLHAHTLGLVVAVLRALHLVHHRPVLGAVGREAGRTLEVDHVASFEDNGLGLLRLHIVLRRAAVRIILRLRVIVLRCRAATVDDAGLTEAGVRPATQHAGGRGEQPGEADGADRGTEMLHCCLKFLWCLHPLKAKERRRL